jgi:hypothetical protein
MLALAAGVQPNPLKRDLDSNTALPVTVCFSLQDSVPITADKLSGTQASSSDVTIMLLDTPNVTLSSVVPVRV